MRRVLLSAVVAVVAAAGCGGGERTRQTRALAPFSRVEVEGSVDVAVKPGRPSAVVTSGSKVIDDVRTQVRGGVLHVAAKREGIVIGSSGFEGTRVELTAPRLTGIAVRGSGDVDAHGLRADALAVTIEGSGDVTAQGTADRLRAEVRGSGDADLTALGARAVRVTIEGSGDVTLGRPRSLDVRVRGSGDVSYAGRPKRLSFDVRGPGDLDRRGP